MDMLDSLDTAVIVALITGICSVVGNSLLSRSYRGEQRYAYPLATASPEDTVTQIYAEKFADISVSMAEISTELKAIKEGILK